MTNGAYLDKQGIQQRVRSAALWAGIAAAIMLWYYYPRVSWTLPEDNPQRIGGQVLLFTLLYGGWAMVVSTVFLLTGAVQALLVDAVAAALSGGLLVVSGLLLFAGGGMQPLLYVIIGALFVHSGLNAWREFRTLSPLTLTGAGDTRYEILGPGLAPPAGEVPEPQPTAVERLRNRQQNPAYEAQPASEPAEENRMDADAGDAEESAPTDPEPTPEGFLAQFGRKDPRSGN
jgi:hypothetical protein